jgi:glycosyltransferase involved in cell wall biosynthesis
MKPFVTALIDTYNHERYIEQAIVSVLEQGLSAEELEIVVVDDGSTDGTASIVEKFAPRVRHVRKKNGGQASAFNVGYRESRGEIVALLDGDDWWEKGKLARVLKAFEENAGVWAVSHSYYRYREGTKEAELYGPSRLTWFSLETREKTRSALANWAFLQPSALTVRRELLERIMPIPEVLVFSADSAIATASMAMGAIVIPEALSYYRLHAENLYEFGSTDPVKLRRKYEMDATMCRVLWPMLLKLGVREECVSELLESHWVWAARYTLKTFGGSRLKTFRAEKDFLPVEASRGRRWLIGFSRCWLWGRRRCCCQPRKILRNAGMVREAQGRTRPGMDR